MVVFNNSRFSAKNHHLPPKLNAGEHFFNLAYTYKTILVVFITILSFKTLL